ncbi:MAG: ATP-grasp fold amidoligase family protein, partial [Chthoniobacterales bacterium]
MQCADKVAVRDYIREGTGDKYLTKLYQVAASFGEINFDALPESFVIKATHDSASAVLVRDKSRLDL